MSIRFEVVDRIAYATIDRPSAMNAIDEGVLSAFEQVVGGVRDNGDAKALVLTGAGDAFCIGLDIVLLGRAFAEPAYFAGVLERFNEVLLRMESLPVPVVAAVNGRARAGGFELLLACDMVIMADDALVADHHLAFGIVPGGGATQRLPRRIGRQRAREIIFTGRWVTSAEAVACGLALRTVPRERLDDEVEALVSVFRGRSRPALAATKLAMNDGEGLPIADAIRVETEHFMRHLTTEPSAAEGFLAFTEKREPRWD